MLRQKAEQHEEGDGLGPLEQPAREVEGLHAARVGAHLPLLGEDREAQKARPVDVEAEKQEGARGAVGGGIEPDEPQGHRAVEEEIARDVEVAAEVRGPCGAGHGAVEAVGETAGKQEEKARKQVSQSDRAGGSEAEGKARERHRIGRDAPARDDTPEGVERRVDQRAEAGVEHGVVLGEASAAHESQFRESDVRGGVPEGPSKALPARSPRGVAAPVGRSAARRLRRLAPP